MNLSTWLTIYIISDPVAQDDLPTCSSFTTFCSNCTKHASKHMILDENKSSEEELMAIFALLISFLLGEIT